MPIAGGVPFSARLRVSRQYQHHHADSLLSFHPDLDALLRDSIEGTHRLVSAIRTERGQERLGVQATPLNQALRRSFSSTKQWTFEALIRDGVIFDNADEQGRVAGFDFARFDEAANIAALWSLCFGRRGLATGPEVWNATLAGRPELRVIAEELAKDWVPGTDPAPTRSTPTILGEIQFGNWALMYRDALKVLAARTEIEVDLFVYVVADGALADMISSSTVNYDRFLKDLVGPFSNVLTVPTWVIGIDLLPEDIPTLDRLTSPTSSFGDA